MALFLTASFSSAFLSCKGEASASNGAGGSNSSGVSDAERLKIFQASPEENLKPTIWDTGDTTVSNEARLDLFWEHAKDLGGGYVGVGSTQNYLLAAWANSEYIWLMDFTRIVVATNKAHIAFIKESPTPEEYLKFWEGKSRDKGNEILKKHYKSEADFNFILSAYKKSKPYIQKRYRNLKFLIKKRNYKVWINDQKFYDRIRNLALKGRIRAIKGNLLGPTTLKGIGDAARKMGVPVRIFYPSNAEEYKIFNPYPEQFRVNLRNLPVDEKSRVLRTISISRHKLPWAPDSKLSSRVGFHYNRQSLQNFQKWLELDPRINVGSLLRAGKIDRKNGFSVIEHTPATKK